MEERLIESLIEVKTIKHQYILGFCIVNTKYRVIVVNNSSVRVVVNTSEYGNYILDPKESVVYSSSNCLFIRSVRTEDNVELKYSKYNNTNWYIWCIPCYTDDNISFNCCY